MGRKRKRKSKTSSSADTAAAAAAPVSEVVTAAPPEVGATATGRYQIEFID